MALNLKLEVESALTHIPEEAYHNLVIAQIESVTVQEFEVKMLDDNGNPSASEYAGLTVPRLVIKTKRQIMPFSTDKNERSDSFSWGVQTTKDWKTGTLKPQKDVLDRTTYDFMSIIHIHNVLRKHNNTKELDLKVLNEYNPFAVKEDRVAKLKEIYTYIASMFNEKLETTGTEQYKDLVLCWVLIPGGGVNRSKYTIPPYVGSGFVEVFKSQQFKPAISIPTNVVMKLGKLEPKTAPINNAIPNASLDALQNLSSLNFGGPQ